MTDKSNAPTGIMIVDDDAAVAGLSKGVCQSGIEYPQDRIYLF
jgi:hypothetical protein